MQSLQQLLYSCSGSLFPFDTYCMMAALSGFDSIHAYAALVAIDNFNGCSIITRSQLDSLARLNGVVEVPDPHALAQRPIAGEKLRRISGKHGRPLTDAYLIEALAKKNSWIKPA